MPNISITVRNKVAMGEDIRLVCENSDYTVLFDFDAEWADYTEKTMRVRFVDGTYYDVLFTGDSAALPVFTEQAVLSIGVYAGNLHTSTPAFFRCASSIRCGADTHVDPPDDVYDQLLERLRQIEGFAPYVGGNGNWFEWDNTTGAYVDTTVPARGPQGPAGDPGETKNADGETIVDTNDTLSAVYDAGKRVADGGEVFNTYSGAGANVASGVASHAEGGGNTTLNILAHAEGKQNTVYSMAGHAEGNSNASGDSSAHPNGYPESVDDTDKVVYTDAFAHVEGCGNIASGGCSHAEGQRTKATGYGAHAEGTADSGAGDWVLASGDGAHAEGYGGAASGAYSHKEGFKGNASAMAAHAEGSETNAVAGSAHAEGVRTRASGQASHAEGIDTIASGQAAHAEGINTFARTRMSRATGALTATGNGAITYGPNATPLGELIDWRVRFAYESGSVVISSPYVYVCLLSHTSETANKPGTAGGATYWSLVDPTMGASTTGTYAEACGHITLAQGNASHSEGRRTNAKGEAAHSEGAETSALGAASHSEGYRGVASGSFSHAEGSQTSASGHISHAEGLSCVASGQYSHAAGRFTIAAGEAQTVVGRFNSENEHALFVVGGGASADNRFNALEVRDTAADTYVPLQVHNNSGLAGMIANEEGNDENFVGVRWTNAKEMVLYANNTIFLRPTNASSRGWKINDNGMYPEVNGTVGLGIASRKLKSVYANTLYGAVATAEVPASSTAAGVKGELAADSDYLYVCTDTNTWKRVALSSW